MSSIETEELEHFAEIITENFIVDLVQVLNQEYETKRNNLQNTGT